MWKPTRRKESWDKIFGYWDLSCKYRNKISGWHLKQIQNNSIPMLAKKKATNLQVFWLAHGRFCASATTPWKPHTGPVAIARLWLDVGFWPSGCPKSFVPRHLGCLGVRCVVIRIADASNWKQRVDAEGDEMSKSCSPRSSGALQSLAAAAAASV